MEQVFRGEKRLRHTKWNAYFLKYLDVLAEIPPLLNYSERLKHVRAKKLVSHLYFYHMPIVNRQKALIGIPFTVEHITEC